jgi:hypothetical protein
MTNIDAPEARRGIVKMISSCVFENATITSNNDRWAILEEFRHGSKRVQMSVAITYLDVRKLRGHLQPQVQLKEKASVVVQASSS